MKKTMGNTIRDEVIAKRAKELIEKLRRNKEDKIEYEYKDN